MRLSHFFLGRELALTRTFFPSIAPTVTPDELADLQAQIALGAKSPGSALPPSSPRTARPTNSQPPPNENTARLEDTSAPRPVITKLVDPPAKRRSLKTLTVDEPLPAGFTVQPPTPIGGTPPRESIPLPETEKMVHTQEPKPFSPPEEDSGRDAAFVPPSHSAADSEDAKPKPFSPPSEDTGRDAGFTPSRDEEDDADPSTPKGDATFTPPTGGEEPSPTSSGGGSATVSRQSSASKTRIGMGVRGPRSSVGGPRGAREPVSREGSGSSKVSRSVPSLDKRRQTKSRR